jgi:hypothetical protein
MADIPKGRGKNASGKTPQELFEAHAKDMQTNSHAIQQQNKWSMKDKETLQIKEFFLPLFMLELDSEGRGEISQDQDVLKHAESMQKGGAQ